MLQSYSAEQPAYYEDQSEGFDLSYFLGIIKRRLAYFLIPFLVILMVGSAIVVIQRPVFRAEGKILVESPEIPADLVRPTITELAEERIQVIQQRLMARDNLLAIVNKYNLFPRERSWMSGTDLLDMMRERTEIKPVSLDSTSARSNNIAIAFNLSFDYEVPELAARVANEFLTSILSQDASTRTNSASETTKFLEREVKRLQSDHDAVVTQIEAQKQRPPDPAQTDSDELKSQQKTLSGLQAELTEKSAIYSAEHPAIKNLKKQIAAVKHDIASAPQTASAAPANQPSADVATEVLSQQRIELERSLDEATRKLTTARLGESMERGEKGERLRVIEQPSVPSKPVRPKRVKWFGVTFALAAIAGAGCIMLVEMLDGSIRGRRELFSIVDKNIIITLPYLATEGEQSRKRRNLIMLCGALVAALAGAIAFAVIKGISVDFSLFDRSGIDALSRILH
jgi:uncharacterized protein involved in exopolysaccharide biosynthesis